MSADNKMAEVIDFLKGKRIALVGLSHDPKHFSHAVWKELAGRDYELIPVNPAHAGEELEGVTTIAHLQELDAPVDGALLMVPPQQALEVVEDALAAGVPRIWLHRGAGKGSVAEEAVAACEKAGVPCIAGECPLMFFRDAGWFHRLHGWGKKIDGSYPS